MVVLPGARPRHAARRNGTRSARTSPTEATGRRPPVDRDPSAIPSQAAARPDERRARRGGALALGRRPRRAGGAQPRHRQRHGAGRSFTAQMAEPAARRAAADRRARARARRSGRGGAGDRASRCARRWRSRAGPPLWSRPTAALARRVSAHLRRWGIEADDSAGRPLSQTPPGTLLLALADRGGRAVRAGAAAGLAQASSGHGGRATGSAGSTARACSTSRCAARARRRGSPGIAAHLADRSGRDAGLRAAAAAWWPDGVAAARAAGSRRSPRGDEPAGPARRAARGGVAACRRRGLGGAGRARRGRAARRARGGGGGGAGAGRRRAICRLCSSG